MNTKPRPNHQQYLRVLAGMTPEERLLKAFELSEMSREVFLAGLRQRFPDLEEEARWKIYLERLAKCRSRSSGRD